MKNIFLLCLLFFSITYAQSQTNLRYNLTKGDHFTIKQDVNQDITLYIEGQEQEIKNNINVTFFYEITGTSSDNYIIDMSFKSIRMRVSVAGTTMMSLDSNSEISDPSQEMFKGMLDKKVTMYMNPSGKIIDVKNGENIIDGMIAAMGEDIDQSIKKEIRKGLEKEYSGKTLSNSFEQMTYYYPSNPKSINETWKNSYIGEGKLNANNEWTYISENENTRIIEGKADVTMNLDSGELLMDLTGSQETIVKTDPTSGFLQEIIVNTTTSGNSHFAQSPDDERPATLKMTTIYTLQ